MKFACFALLFFCLTHTIDVLPTTGQALDAPEIRSLDPERAGAGQRVIIRGRNFSAVAAENVVFFGQQQVEVRKAKKRKLVLDLPDDLEAGEHLVMVVVAGQASNTAAFEFVPPVKPFQGEYKGQTSQEREFNFIVQEDRERLWKIRTSYTCAAESGCSAAVTVVSDKFVQLEKGHFELTLSTLTFSAHITGLFLNENEAEGTAEFSVAGSCACETGKLKWQVKRDVTPPL